MLFRAISAETLKYHRSPALLLAVGVPLLLDAVMWLAFTLSPHLARRWPVLGNQVSSVWALMLLPLGIAILASIASGIEHSENHLKHMLVLPPSRLDVYIAKGLGITALVAIGVVVLVLAELAVGLLLGFKGPLSWSELLVKPLLASVASLPLITLGLWLGLRFRSFAIGMGVGLGGTIAGFIAVRSTTYWKYVPWTYPTSALSSGDVNLALVLAGGVALAILVVGALDFTLRDAP